MFLVKNMVLQYKCMPLEFTNASILNYLWNLLDYTVYLVLFT